MCLDEPEWPSRSANLRGRAVSNSKEVVVYSRVTARRKLTSWRLRPVTWVNDWTQFYQKVKFEVCKRITTCRLSVKRGPRPTTAKARTRPWSLQSWDSSDMVIAWRNELYDYLWCKFVWKCLIIKLYLTYRNVFLVVFGKLCAALNKSWIGWVLGVTVDQMRQHKLVHAGLIVAVSVIDQSAKSKTVGAIVAQFMWTSWWSGRTVSVSVLLQDSESNDVRYIMSTGGGMQQTTAPAPTMSFARIWVIKLTDNSPKLECIPGEP